MKTSVLMLLFPLICLTACSTERVVIRTIPVEVIVRERIAVPAEHLVTIEPQARPAGSVTYGQAIELWSHDRASIGILNGQLDAIGALNDESQPGEN